MGYILGVLDYIAYIAVDVDFYNIEGNSGDSYLPFVGFMLFLIGFVVIFMGFSKYLTAKKNFNLFYDQRDKKDLNSPVVIKDRKVGIIMLVVGIVMMIASNFII